MFHIEQIALHSAKKHDQAKNMYDQKLLSNSSVESRVPTQLKLSTIIYIFIIFIFSDMNNMVVIHITKLNKANKDSEGNHLVLS